MFDLPPLETKRWQKVESIIRRTFRRAALEEIRTPILENTDLFSRGIGEGTDVVGKEMYTFLDRGERSCTLRPEGTASVVRAIIQNGLINQGCQRLWYSGPMFRYERPQAGRQRQFHQIGVEFFGLETVQSDAELIVLGWDLLKDLGLDDLILEVNSLGNEEDRKRFRSIFVSWLEDNFNLLDSDSQQRLKRNPLRILDTKNSDTQELLIKAPSIKDALSQESLKRFEDLQNALIVQKIPFKVNFGLVRGLDYYCHTAFEIKSAKLGAQSTVCGGGRYDGLVKKLGGPDIPSIGWAVGMERLVLLLENCLNSAYKALDIYLINRGDMASKYALSLSRKLRSADFSVEIDHTGSTFSKQFKRANRSGSKWIIVLGDNEINEGTIKVKELNQDINKKVEERSFGISDFEGLISFLSNLR